MLNTRKLPLGIAFTLVVLPAPAQSTEPQLGSIEIGATTSSELGPDHQMGKYEVVPTGLGVFDIKLRWSLSGNMWMEFKASDVGTRAQSAELMGGRKGDFKWSVSWDEIPYYTGTGHSYFTETSPGVFRLPDALRTQMQAVFWNSSTTGSATNSALGGPIGSINTAGTGYVLSSGVPSMVAADPRMIALGASLGYYTLSGTNPLAGVVAGNVTSGTVNLLQLNTLNGSYAVRDVDLLSRRRTGKAGFEFTGLEDWKFGFNYRLDRRDGNQSTSIYDGTTILQYAAPIDYKTHNIRASAEYATGRWFGELALDFSKFTDDLHGLYIDNPMRLTNNPASFVPTSGTIPPGGVSYRQQQAAVLGTTTLPDNQAVGLSLSGGLVLPARHRLTVSYSSTSMSMDTDLMAGSTIPYYLDQRNGLSSISAKMESTFFNARISGDPLRVLGYSLTFRRYELKDKTEEYDFPIRGRGDSSQPSVDDHGHDNQGWKKDTLKAEVHTTIIKGLRFGLTWAEDKSEYQTRFAEKLKDTTLTFTADGHYGMASFHGSFADLHRKPSNWEDGQTPDTAGVGSFTDQAARDSKLYTAITTLSPLDNLSVSLSAFGVDNTFTESVLHGLQASRNDNYGLDLSYALSDKLSLVAAYVYETYWYDMKSHYLGTSAATALPNDKWSNRSQDKVDTYRLGLHWNLVPGRLDASTDLDYSKGRSDSAYAVDPTPLGATHSWQSAGYNSNPIPTGTAIPYGYDLANAGPYLIQPQVVSETTIWKTRLSYRINKDLSVSLLYWVQKLKAADWAKDQMMPYMYSVDPGTNKSLFLGTQALRYDARILRASLSYRF